MSFNDVHPGDPMNAVNVQQVIDALKGTAGKGIPLVVDAVNDGTRYALTLQNDEATNSRALNVLKSDGTVLIAADATGVTLGSPVNLQSNSVPGTAITNASITNAKLGPDVARANLLTNGGFEIWQRGNGPFAASAAFGPDRWQMFLNGSDTYSLSRDTANADAGSTACAALSFTLGSGAGVSNFVQKLVVTDYASLRGRTVSLSIRVKTSTANAIRASVNSDGTGGTTATSSFHTGGGAYETLTVTYAIPSDATYIQVKFNPAVSCIAYVDNANLVVGSQPADYVPLHPADDLARCLRYYESGTGNSYLAVGVAMSGTTSEFVYPHLAQKAVTPSVTCSGGTVRVAGTGLAVTGYPGLIGGLSRSLIQASTVATGLTAGGALTWSGATIAIEANT